MPFWSAQNLSIRNTFLKDNNPKLNLFSQNFRTCIYIYIYIVDARNKLPKIFLTDLDLTNLHFNLHFNLDFFINILANCPSKSSFNEFFLLLNCNCVIF